MGNLERNQLRKWSVAKGAWNPKPGHDKPGQGLPAAAATETTRHSCSHCTATAAATGLSYPCFFIALVLISSRNRSIRLAEPLCSQPCCRIEEVNNLEDLFVCWAGRLGNTRQPTSQIELTSITHAKKTIIMIAKCFEEAPATKVHGDVGASLGLKPLLALPHREASSGWTELPTPPPCP